MRICKKPISYFSFSLLFLLCFALVTPTQLSAQPSDKIPNIAPDEFTAKGGDMGWSVGATVTNLSFNDVFNKGFKLYEKLDKPVLIEIWSMNCQQCKRNKKYLKSFYTQYNIDIISICTDDYPNEIRKMAQQNNYPWSTIHDDSPKFNQGASFSEVNDLGAAKFILLTPDKQVYRVYNSEKAIGKVGVDLQQYFSK